MTGRDMRLTDHDKGVFAYPVLGSTRLHSYPLVYLPATGTAERDACVPCG